MTSAVHAKARMQPGAALNHLTATEITGALAAGETTCEAVVRHCLARIETREHEIHAWVNLDPDLALRQARALDAASAARRGQPLFGVPVGVKDIIDTEDFPTEMGSPIYRGHRPQRDAACVALLRAAGAVILGKTATCEFAGMTPGPTANPHDSAHTPGGSSSGSGAAVADFMVPIALGTQTGGSVLRPASYCGVFGFKPTFGAFNRRGVYPAAESLDTIGLIARSIEDIALASAVLEMRPAAQLQAPERPPRVGVCRTPLWQTAQPETVAAVEDAAQKLAAAGAQVRSITLPDEFAGLRNAARETINNFERAAAMAPEWAYRRDLISDRLRKRIELGRAMPHAEYAATLRLGETCRNALPRVFEDLDMLLAPAANGEAPRGLSDTGDPDFQALWTILYVPTLTIPTHRGRNGLPVGVQLVAPRHADQDLLAWASWAWQRLGTREMVGYWG
jgi:amidase